MMMLPEQKSCFPMSLTSLSSSFEQEYLWRNMDHGANKEK